MPVYELLLVRRSNAIFVVHLHVSIGLSYNYND